MKQYFIVKKPTPVLNISNFLSVFNLDKKNLKKDPKGHTRELEFIALKNMIFEIIEKTDHAYIYKVKCSFYKSSNLYIDSRFCIFSNKKMKPNLKYNLIPHKIIKKLNSYINLPYIWGANYFKGCVDILKFYPTILKDKKDINRWIFKGLDCSGLLFDVTNGYIKRNTSDLLSYKNKIDIESLNPFEIQKKIKPLDLIVFKGHVIIIIDSITTIESREKKGVYKENLIKRLNEIMKTKTPKNIFENENNFVIRRWIDVDQFLL
jgi:6-pyruvoyl-tetrahydropterin synthase